MDPASIFGAFSGGIQVLQAIASTAHGLKQLIGKFKDADFTIKTLLWELSCIGTALEGLQDWSNRREDEYKPDEFSRDLAMAMEGCHSIMAVLSRDVADMLQGLQPDGEIGLRIRIKAIWKEDVMKGHQEMLRAQVQALQLLLQVFHW